jgi:G3E family GTPase
LTRAGDPSGPLETRLIGGFLGAGKTTFILEQLQGAAGKVAVLVNEFGTLGIDGDLIRLQGGIDVVEMPGGCICCSQKLGLIESIRQIAEKLAPTLLLIEPSGVAELSELLQVLADPSLAQLIRLGPVTTLIDAETFLEFSEPEAFGLFFLDQVRCADLVLINKSDLVSTSVLQRIEERIALHNPAAPAVRTEYCRIAEPVAPGSASRGAAAPPTSTPLHFDCLSVPLERALGDEELGGLLDGLRRGRFGRVVRGKGFLDVEQRGRLNLQFVSGRATLTPMPAGPAPRLILIGFGLRAGELDAFFAGPRRLEVTYP